MRQAALAPGVLAALLLGACGSSARPLLRISAAASLRRAFGEYGSTFEAARTSFSFAGSDSLAAQIEAGARPDVFASANTTLPAQLYRAGLAERPVEFAGNRLVLAVPAGSRIAGLEDAERRGVKLAAGSATVPIGAYTLKVLERLPAAQRFALLANIDDNEPDVTGIVGKLTQGALDGGFVYATDVKASGGALRAVQLPATAQPRVGYAAAVLRGSAHRALARAFLAGLRGGQGQADLLRDGFLPPGGG
ncbi:MAG: molybdate ABC transporter substrate-binding protein [Solirubrobacteraceae bacterium]